MADNVNITPGSGDVVAADDISSAKYQRIKLTLGADGVNDGDVSSSNPIPSVLNAQTGNGFSMFRNAALSNTATAAKAGAGNLTGCHIYNPNSADAFVQFYDVAAGSVTVGTTTPNWTMWIPASGAVDSGFPPSTFATAITVAATTTIGGSTAPSTGLLVNLQYK